MAFESSVTLSPQIQILDESTLPLEPVEYSPLRELSPQKREIKVDNQATEEDEKEQSSTEEAQHIITYVKPSEDDSEDEKLRIEPVPESEEPQNRSEEPSGEGHLTVIGEESAEHALTHTNSNLKSKLRQANQALDADEGDYSLPVYDESLSADQLKPTMNQETHQDEEVVKEPELTLKVFEEPSDEHQPHSDSNHVAEHEEEDAPFGQQSPIGKPTTEYTQHSNCPMEYTQEP